MGKHNIIDLDDLPTICNKYRDGTSLGKLAQQYNCSRAQIKNILLSQGVELRRRKPREIDPTPEQIEERAAEVRRNNGSLPGYEKVPRSQVKLSKYPEEEYEQYNPLDLTIDLAIGEFYGL